MSATKQEILRQLQQDILPLQGFKLPSANRVDVSLGRLNDAFPNRVYPLGAVHEFITNSAEDVAASGGFIAGILGNLMQQGGACIWIGSGRLLFPPALQLFGVEPDRVIFIDIKKEKDALWAMEEALKCEGLAAVIGEIKEISFIASRRLQLAVEQSRVTGFLMRHQVRSFNTIACVARWKITSLASEPEEGMPGVGHARWNVELLRIRNGKTGQWQVEWSDGLFHVVDQDTIVSMPAIEMHKTGTYG